MNGYYPRAVTKNSITAIGASATDSPITEVFNITAGGARMMVIKIKVSAATVATGITAKLQTAIDQEWVDSKTVTITAGAGNFYIKLLAEASADQTYLPLLVSGRVVVTTGSGDSVTVSKVSVAQEE